MSLIPAPHHSRLCSECGANTFYIVIKEEQVNCYCSRCGMAVVVLRYPQEQKQ